MTLLAVRGKAKRKRRVPQRLFVLLRLGGELHILSTTSQQHQTKSTASSAADRVVHDEVRYFGDKFLAEQQRLQAKPSEESAPSF